MRIEGLYLEAGSSRACRAWLTAAREGLEVHWDDRVRRAALEELCVSSRLARVPRRLDFPDGASFSTLDNDAIDEALSALGHFRHPTLVDRLERRWLWALAAFAALPLCLWLLFTEGLPLVAGPLSKAIPERVIDLLEDTILEVLENQVFEPSELTSTRQSEIEALLDALQPEVPVALLFRGGGMLGANALALPGGTLILTDELVALTKYDGELAAVLAHEIAHVEERHALRALIQAVGAATVLGWIFGDLTLVTDLALVSAPGLLQQLGYTRSLEREADRLARERLARHGIPVSCLASLMQRLADHTGQASEVIPGWLHTHPGFEERIAAASTGEPCQD